DGIDIDGILSLQLPSGVNGARSQGAGRVALVAERVRAPRVLELHERRRHVAMHRELAIEAGGMLENVARRRETLRCEQRGARSFHDRRCCGEHLSFWRELAPVQRELRLR